MFHESVEWASTRFASLHPNSSSYKLVSLSHRLDASSPLSVFSLSYTIYRNACIIINGSGYIFIVPFRSKFMNRSPYPKKAIQVQPKLYNIHSSPQIPELWEFFICLFNFSFVFLGNSNYYFYLCPKILEYD